MIKSNDDGYKYYYDYENRLIEVRTEEDEVVVEYTYNALGRQSQKHEVLWDDDDYVRFYYNKDYQVLMETDNSVYEYMGGWVDEEEFFRH